MVDKMDIFTACKNGSYDTVAELLRKEGLVNTEQTSSAHRTGLCGTPLMFAVRFHQMEIARLLVQNGADVNRTRDNRGSLSIAIEENFLEAIHFLLEVNVDVTETDFMLALTSKRWEIATLLLERPFNMFYVASSGSTFLHTVVCEDMMQLAEAIMAKAPRLIHIKNANGKTPLTIAVEKEFCDMAVLIRKYSTQYQLENYKSASIKKYDECQSAMNTAEKMYKKKTGIVEDLRGQIEKTQIQLQNLQYEFKDAQKNAEKAKENFEGEMETVNKKIALKPYNNLLECPVCLDIPFQPKLIFQCDDGHVICSDCRLKVHTCPECRCELKKEMVRNRRLEGLVEQLDQSIQCGDAANLGGRGEG